MSEQDSFKKLAEDLLGYVTKDTFKFVQRYHNLISGTQEEVPESNEPKAQPEKKPLPSPGTLPGMASAQSFNPGNMVKRAKPVTGEPHEEDIIAQPQISHKDDENDAPF